jgi:hypothetical protein
VIYVACILLAAVLVLCVLILRAVNRIEWQQMIDGSVLNEVFRVLKGRNP